MLAIEDTMKNKLIAFVVVVLLCVGCSPKPTDEDVGAVLTENIPPALKPVAAIDQTQAEISSAGDDLLVKFKTHLKLSQPLFDAIEFESAAKAAGGDNSSFGEIEKRSQKLTAAGRESLADAIKAATNKPTFLAESSAAGIAVEWYGSFKAKKVVDRWVSSDFKTDIEPKFKGRPRSEFPESAIESAKANGWFTDIKVKQVALLQKIDTAQQLERKDAEASQAQIDNAQLLAQKETELSEAKNLAAQKLAQRDAEVQHALAIAQRERVAKEGVIAQQQRQARQMPIKVQFRRAAIGGTSVMRIEAGLAITVRMDVARGAQTFARDLQVASGRVVEIGHLEGWGFKSGDMVRLSNPSFDTVSFTAP